MILSVVLAVTFPKGSLRMLRRVVVPSACTDFLSQVHSASCTNDLVLSHWGHSNRQEEANSRTFYSGPSYFPEIMKSEQQTELMKQLQDPSLIGVAAEGTVRLAELDIAFNDFSESFLDWGVVDSGNKSLSLTNLHGGFVRV